MTAGLWNFRNNGAVDPVTGKKTSCYRFERC